MAINKTSLETSVQSQIDGFTSAASPEDMLSAASSTRNLTDDVQSFVSLGCELPDLSLGTTPIGSMFYVDELGVPVVASFRSWLGLDGRVYRKDIPDGLIYAWGSGTSGMTGTGDKFTKSSPVQEACSATNWCFIGSSVCASHAINFYGQLFSWGCGRGGVLANGSETNQCIPIRENSSSSDWLNVSGGYLSAYAVKTDGTLWAWGSQDSGGLANNVCDLNIRITSPIQEISSSTNWSCVDGTNTNISGGAAIKTDGTLWGWGNNNNGKLGTNDTVPYSSPVQEISSSTNWSEISLGRNGLSAIKIDGTLWSAGYNAYGILATGNVICYSSPVQEFTSSFNWCKISSGECNAAGIKTDGTLWAWGRGSNGNMGNNTNITCYSSPVQEITSSTNWCKVCISCTQHALKTDGTLWGWGTNSYGQLAINSVIKTSSPIQEFTSSTNWSQVSSQGAFAPAVAAIKQVV